MKGRKEGALHPDSAAISRPHPSLPPTVLFTVKLGVFPPAWAGEGGGGKRERVLFCCNLKISKFSFKISVQLPLSTSIHPLREKAAWRASFRLKKEPLGDTHRR